MTTVNQDVSINTSLIIKNVPSYALNNKDTIYWIVTLVEKELWFYGAFEFIEDAYDAIHESPDSDFRFVVQADVAQ